MKFTDLGKLGKINASSLALGCMRISGKDKKEVETIIGTALDCGINFFDHADIYGGGKSEEIFGAAFSAPRDSVYIQSKCGIRPGFFDFSKEHIIASAEASLKRLGTDYLDVLLLHRPDTLMEPEEVAEAFTTLEKSGKVRFFGVSNQNPYQMALLQKYMPQKIVANQLQFGLAHRRITLRVLREHHRFSKSGDNLFPQFVLCVISVAPIDDLAGALAVDPYVF